MPVDNLPRPPAPVFRGRDAALARLAKALTADPGAPVTQAVAGEAGVGKSELALQHATDHRGAYEVVWWIPAADAGQVEAGLAALAERLRPPSPASGGTPEAAARALRWLEEHDRWLLILDNVEDPQDVAALLGQPGHIVLTTREDPDWLRFRTTPLRLGALDPEPAAQIITARTGHTSKRDQASAAKVAAELGFFPLALAQAAAYMVQARIRPGQYLDQLRRHPSRRYAATAGPAQQTIARLWDIAAQAIGDRDPGAVALLQQLACYAPDNIPRAILGGRGYGDRARTDAQLGELAAYGLITLTAGTVSVHRLVQAVALDQQPAPGPGPADTALDWLDEAIPADAEGSGPGWPLLRALTPHADALASHYPAGRQPLRLGRVYNEFALCYQAQGQYQRALALREAALQIYQEHLEADHPDLATVLGNLAATYGALGRPADALPLQQRALDITEAALGPDHPDVAIRLGNLALTYGALGRPADALPRQQQALIVSEMALGPDHPRVAIALGNLAATYGALGRPADALPLELRALEVTEMALDPGHPDVAVALGNLALTYSALGRAADALPLEERALRITKAAFGPDHPRVAAALANLAGTYLGLGRAADALPLERRALQITEMALGPAHPRVAIRLGNLAITYKELGRPADALPLEQLALRISESALGPDHPDVAVALANLAITYKDLGRAGDAVPLQQRALHISVTAFGRDHPRVAIRLGNLALTYRDLGRPREALPLQQRALQISESARSPRHPDVAIGLANLASTYRDLGREADARRLEQRISGLHALSSR